jgi:Nucleotidyltransferase of unknown function (DUF6036)
VESVRSFSTKPDAWQYIEKTNDELQSSGLYITHLFAESQVILSSRWLDRLEPINLSGLKHLRIYRPSVNDLILTKMMRIDPQDRSDIEYLVRQLPNLKIDELLADARVPDIAEIREAFEENSRWLLKKIGDV